MFRNYPKLKLVIGAGILFLLIIVLSLTVAHRGKTKVSVTVAPGDSQVLVNGKEQGAGTLYLEPGKYTFVAKKSGFADDSETVEVKSEPVSVNLVPAPTSPEAFAYLQQNPDVQAAREAIGGQQAQAYGQALKDETPLISQLPYTDINGPFTINYGPSTTRKDGVFLLISNTSPRGRANALKWIRQQGYDPTDLEIIYAGYANPLSGEAGNE
jgi:hypothetical protein